MYVYVVPSVGPFLTTCDGLYFSQQLHMPQYSSQDYQLFHYSCYFVAIRAHIHILLFYTFCASFGLYLNDKAIQQTTAEVGKWSVSF